MLLEDIAMLGRAPNPFNALRTLTYCNGIHSRGVLGAVRCLTDTDVRDANESYLKETFPYAERFVVLMRVQVLGGETISPSLKNRSMFHARVTESLMRHSERDKDTKIGRDVCAAEVSVRAARDQLDVISPELCEKFIKLWQQDLAEGVNIWRS